MEVYIGVALGAPSGHFGSLGADLQGQEIRHSKDFVGRFERVVAPVAQTGALAADSTVDFVDNGG